MAVNPKIFRAYDIRGVYPDEINEEAAEQIGRAFVQFLSSEFKIQSSELRIVIGQDCRTASPKLFKSFSQTVVEQGAEVVDIGLVSTDTLYFALNYLDMDGAIMITASHNPPEYGGIKMVARGPRFICGDWGIPQIKEMVLSGQMMGKKRGGVEEIKAKGKIVKKDIIPDYLKYILNLVDLDKIKPLKVVVDATNGMGGEIIQKLASRVPIKLFPLYFKPDGRFPNHLPDPLIEVNLEDIKKEVINQQADFGFALDADADRTIFIDEKGQAISGDMIIILFALEFLRREPGASVVYNLTCSKSVPEVIKENNGRPIRTRTGHAFMKSAARKNKAIFGGEISGHLYFRDVFYAECGGLTLLLMLKILSESKQSLSELIEQFKRYYRIGEVNFKVKDRRAAIEKLAEAYKSGQQDRVDGLTVEFDDWWFNARPSNTEPLLRIVVEAKDEKKAKSELEKISSLINEKI